MSLKSFEIRQFFGPILPVGTGTDQDQNFENLGPIRIGKPRAWPSVNPQRECYQSRSNHFGNLPLTKCYWDNL